MAGVFDSVVCADGDVRLMNGSVPSLSSGRVEVCVNNSYGSVCHDRWDQLDATIVCRQLNMVDTSKCVPLKGGEYTVRKWVTTH